MLAVLVTSSASWGDVLVALLVVCGALSLAILPTKIRVCVLVGIFVAGIVTTALAVPINCPWYWKWICG